MIRTNRKVIVTFKPEQKLNHTTGELMYETRPPFETTEANLNEVKRIHGKIFKEARFADDDQPVNTPAQKPHVVEKIVEKIVEKVVKGEATDTDIVMALAKKGKTANSIARTLDIPIAEVEKILQDNLIGA